MAVKSFLSLYFRSSFKMGAKLCPIVQVSRLAYRDYNSGNIISVFYFILFLSQGPSQGPHILIIYVTKIKQE
jgi:hypothetical protein